MVTWLVRWLERRVRARTEGLQGELAAVREPDQRHRDPQEGPAGERPFLLARTSRLTPPEAALPSERCMQGSGHPHRDPAGALRHLHRLLVPHLGR